MPGKQPIRFYQLLEQHVVSTIKKKFLNEQLTPTTLKAVRDEIRLIVNNVFDQSAHKLSIEAQNWVANQLFCRMKVNDDQIVNDLVVINEYDLSKMSLEDIGLMRDLFNETVFAEELEKAYSSKVLS